MQRAFATVPRVMLLAAAFQLGGCIAPVYRARFGADPVLDQALQSGHAENLYRIWHFNVPLQPPLRAEAGNVWPGAPDKVPTSFDLLKQGTPAGPPAAPVRAAFLRMHRRGYGMCQQAAVAKDASVPHEPAPPGVALGLCFTGG